MTTINEAAAAYSETLDAVADAAGQDRDWATSFVARLCARGYTLWTEDELDELSMEQS